MLSLEIKGFLLALGGLIAVAQMTTVGEVKTHETAMRRHECLINLEVGRATAQALDVDTPLLRVEVEGLEGALLAEQLNLVDELITTVVASSGVALRVLVRHGGAEGIEDGAGGDVLRSNQNDRLPLALNLLGLEGVSGRRDDEWELLTMISATSGSDSTRDFSSI